MTFVEHISVGDQVTVHMGGDCGISLHGQVESIFRQGNRPGMILKNDEGKLLTLYFEELDDCKVNPVSHS